MSSNVASWKLHYKWRLLAGKIIELNLVDFPASWTWRFNQQNKWWFSWIRDLETTGNRGRKQEILGVSNKHRDITKIYGYTMVIYDYIPHSSSMVLWFYIYGYTMVISKRSGQLGSIGWEIPLAMEGSFWLGNHRQMLRLLQHAMFDYRKVSLDFSVDWLAVHSRRPKWNTWNAISYANRTWLAGKSTKIVD